MSDHDNDIPDDEIEDSEDLEDGGLTDKTNIIASDTFKLRLEEATREPASLVLLVGPSAFIGKQWQLNSSDLVIGRSVNSHIYINDKSVSKSHAKVVLDGYSVSLMDLESTNKTVINGNQLPSLVPVKLNNNDQIRVGNVILKFLEEGNIETVSAKDTYDRSQKDSLTGIHNKGALLAYAPEAFKRSQLLQFPLSLLVFDIDFFKKINDTYGHAAGDIILREMVNLIGNKMIRADDFFARFGGEEFVILLYGNTLTRAMEIAERIRQTVEDHDFIVNGTKIDVTISLGVAVRSPEMGSWGELFEKADKALYQSKNSGRNRVSKLQ